MKSLKLRTVPMAYVRTNMARPLKYKGMVDNITRWLKDELKHDAEIVNGLDHMTDGTEDIVHGRYEVSRELLNYIRSLNGESQNNLDEGV